jgi:hypothetical protein
MKRLIVVFLMLSGFSQAQYFKKAAALPINEDIDFQSTESFCVYKNSIFIYSYPQGLISRHFSEENKSNSLITNSRIDMRIRRYKHIILDYSSNMYDIHLNQAKVSPLRKYAYKVGISEVIPVLSDSIIYLFINPDSPGNEKQILHTYNLRTFEKDKNILPNLVGFINDNRCYLYDIYAYNGILYILFESYILGGSSIFIAWNSNNDSLSSPIISYPEEYLVSKIKGVDPLGLWILTYPGHSLLILGPDFEVINYVKYGELFLEETQISKDELNFGENGIVPPLLVSQDENKKLFLLAKLKRELRVYEFNYFPLLTKYFESAGETQLRIFRNTIFAGHGRLFKSKDLRKYFSRQYWYKPDKNYSDSLLTNYDRDCINFIRNFEKNNRGGNN